MVEISPESKQQQYSQQVMNPQLTIESEVVPEKGARSKAKKIEVPVEPVK